MNETASSDFKLDPDEKAKWTAALRDGTRLQGRLNLKEDDRYCCLGVYADLNGLLTEDCGGRSFVLDDHFFEGLSYAYLPTCIIPVDIQSQLVAMNDRWGKSFSEIADWIDENL